MKTGGFCSFIDLFSILFQLASSSLLNSFPSVSQFFSMPFPCHYVIFCLPFCFASRLSYVVSNSFSLPSSLSTFARDLITRLLKGQFYNTSHIKTHPFFLGINWKMVSLCMHCQPANQYTQFVSIFSFF